jgi:hypothetical protein
MPCLRELAMSSKRRGDFEGTNRRGWFKKSEDFYVDGKRSIAHGR